MISIVTFLLTLTLAAPSVLAEQESYNNWLTHAIEIGDLQISDKVHRNTGTEDTPPTLLSPVAADDILCTIPLSSVLTSSSAASHPALQQVLAQEEIRTITTSTVTLALVMMYEKSLGKDSKWSEMLANLPEFSASTVYWPQTDLVLLNGTAAFSKTVERVAALASMHKSLQPFMSPIFETFELNDFVFFVTTIFARSVPAQGESSSMPLMLPFVEALPRAVRATTRVEVREEDGKPIFVLLANQEMKAGEVLTFATTGTTNTDLLLNTGQFIMGNPAHGIPFSIRLPSTDPHVDMKLKVLSQLNLTQTTEFIIR